MSVEVVLAGAAVLEAAAVEPVLVGPLATERLARSDRVTLGLAAVSGRALAGLMFGGDDASVITASWLATEHTNHRFETRRQAGLAVEPRTFPYTAPNAAGGELAIALHARGPMLALVGGVEVGLAALERAIAWLGAGRCRQVLVAVGECPWDGVDVGGVRPVEVAVAFVLERAEVDDPRPRLRAGYVGGGPATTSTPLLSVGPLLDLWTLAQSVEGGRVVATPEVGAAIYVDVARRPEPRMRTLSEP